MIEHVYFIHYAQSFGKLRHKENLGPIGKLDAFWKETYFLTLARCLYLL